MPFIRRSLARQGFKDYISRKLSLFFFLPHKNQKSGDTAYRGDVRPKAGRKSVLRQSPGSRKLSTTLRVVHIYLLDDSEFTPKYFYCLCPVIYPSIN
ncbi:MAG: hypothetical protein DWQ58_19130 [Microcystis aeruginosa TA09]|nr:MAG: hypothetical protein DWQ58_19130 [Microcystis aeruginosa TA09]